MARTHQPGQAAFKSVLPEDIEWKPFPAFPPSVRLAVVVGQPSEPGPYVIRVKVPSGVKLMPQSHPEDRGGAPRSTSGQRFNLAWVFGDYVNQISSILQKTLTRPLLKERCDHNVANLILIEPC